MICCVWGRGVSVSTHKGLAHLISPYPSNQSESESDLEEEEEVEEIEGPKVIVSDSGELIYGN